MSGMGVRSWISGWPEPQQVCQQVSEQLVVTVALSVDDSLPPS